MINDHFPWPGEVTVTRSNGPEIFDGVRLETGALGRAGAGEAVPFAAMIPPDWNGGVVVWAHPDGKASLFTPLGTPDEPIKRLLGHGYAVISADLFLTGEFVQGGKPAAVVPSTGYEKQTYAGFYYGYNRGVLANRVHDLLTEIGYARRWKNVRRVELVAFGDVGPAALLARALAGEAVVHSYIDLNGFDFDRITDSMDPMMLPGALKYGGIYGFAPLCRARISCTLLAGATAGLHHERAVFFPDIKLQEAPLDPGKVVDALLEVSSQLPDHVLQK